MIEPRDLSKDELLALLSDAAKNWLAHDGLWFQAVEGKFGMDAAIALDGQAWQEFTQIEAKRIMKRLNIQPGEGIPALIQALQFRLYAFINEQKVVEATPTRCIFQMTNCRVQEARKRKNLPDFPCKPVGIIEYTYFARTIDPRIQTRCIACPPDPHPPEYYCQWEFTIAE
ncbi:hypothetical protein AMJ87_08060 [candidate division WOR_3 bacterium SM23_60]|uniref:Cytosolic protein n=1 Tax=candidate division WOR_3 bacterium SM23_60 TaxID=1703780 RepID=A0A0S8GE09_UNCW3|nr:MAG: hypothetical protein AMJ87_08060 [candidate division WOR_3 bacterium SM23_60]